MHEQLKPTCWAWVTPEGRVCNAFPYRPEAEDPYWVAKGYTTFPLYAIPADQVLVPRELLERIDTALTRHLAQHGPMRVPPDPTDSDLVREEVRALLHP